jgi:hypothetical protein
LVATAVVVSSCGLFPVSGIDVDIVHSLLCFLSEYRSSHERIRAYAVEPPIVYFVLYKRSVNAFAFTFCEVLVRSLFSYELPASISGETFHVNVVLEY